jgi:4a-hydroxytetrahydrobiopterin dehydratase
VEISDFSGPLFCRSQKGTLSLARQARSIGELYNSASEQLESNGFYARMECDDTLCIENSLCRRATHAILERRSKTMEQLSQKRCIPCEGGVLPASAEEIAVYLRELPGWVIEEAQPGGVQHLVKSFAFDNFAHALAFTDRIGALAEEEGHHPVLVTEWGKVTASWWTHAIGGLHQNDFVMAAKTNQAFQTAKGAK